MRMGLHGEIWATFSRGLLGRAQQAGAPTGKFTWWHRAQLWVGGNSTGAMETDGAFWNIKLGGNYEFTGAYVGGDDY